MNDANKKMEGEPEVEEASRTDSAEPSSAEAAEAQESESSKLRQQLEIKEQEAKNNYERFLRQAAELENFKKRTARERDEAVRFANEYLIKDLLPVLDNLERAVAHAKGGGNGEPLVVGVDMVLKGLLDVLCKHGVAPIGAMGQPFDPGVHEAIAQVDSADHPANTVVEEHHKGYLFHDRLLRPALVSVAKTPKGKEKKSNGGEVENEPRDD